MTLKNKLFVHRCIKNEPSKGWFGLCNNKYKVGDYITYSGQPTKNINEATVNTYENYNLDEGRAWNYFKLLECKIVLVK